ncbi:MAG: holo-ACP synthase [Gallionellaceae bacterium]|jgi:holo-[acyl-carrier protein] synthase|nr:holo-ACP synthase [Gallionellaceae bacterium]
MTIFGIGTDVVSYRRIQELHSKYGERFARRLLTDAEMPECADNRDPARYLMKRFAAKEAFAKALGTGLRGEVALHRMGVTHDELGKPTLVFDDTLATRMKALGVASCHLSISDEADVAVAFVVLERDV